MSPNDLPEVEEAVEEAGTQREEAVEEALEEKLWRKPSHRRLNAVAGLLGVRTKSR